MDKAGFSVNQFLRSIATQAVEAQSENDSVKLLDLLSDIRSDLDKAEQIVIESFSGQKG